MMGNLNTCWEILDSWIQRKGQNNYQGESCSSATEGRGLPDTKPRQAPLLGTCQKEQIG
jgi:hypothetical protein